VHVLLAVRGDFVTRVGALPGLGDAVERALFLLQPLTPDGVREAIVGPARSRGVVFESEALLQTLVDATAHGAGSLPLLQFTLAELWGRRDSVRRCITRAALDEMGGVAGALSRHADGVLARLDQAGQRAARRILGLLLTAEGTRSERSEEELTAGSGEARTALRALIEGRLLHARSEAGRSSYEIAHEALIASWGTLRQWLDEDAGQRALRQRIEGAAAEWERLERAEELLWRQRQLGEAQALDATTLGPREQDFLNISRHAVWRLSVRRWLVALLLLFTAGGIYGGPRLKEHLGTQRFVNTRMQEAQGALARGRDLSRRASESHQKALPLFDGNDPDDPGASMDPQKLWLRANVAWDRALDEFKQADAAYAAAERALDDVLDRAHDHPEARRILTGLTYERILLAERFHQADARARLAQRFERLIAGDAAWRGRLESPADLEIVTTPPGARVELTRYVDDKGVLRRESMPGHGLPGPTPIARMSLPPGSYHLHFTREGFAPVDLPLWLERGEHQLVHLKLPSTVPEGYVYIPPGRFFTGSADSEELRGFLISSPLHKSELQEGYFIGRTEVTLGDWLKYLDTLPRSAPERRFLTGKRAREIGGTDLTLSQLADGTWSFTLSLAQEAVLSARAGQPVHYSGRTDRSEQDWLRFPLTGVSAEDLKGYIAWLDRSGQLPGARLCNELEWARAASGADDRRFPHGNRLQKDDANIDATYDFRRDASGPDEVGAHPASVSPFGLHDMAGNAIEITRPMMPGSDAIVLRGGAWYYGAAGALIANRQQSVATLRDPRVGVRLCASLPAR
jgi:formylglycine-generating enzyme required for sulfatase activity